MALIAIAESDEEIARCLPVMHPLRTHLVEADFVPTIKRQPAGGYALAYLEKDGEVSWAIASSMWTTSSPPKRIAPTVTARPCSSGSVGRAREEGCTYLEPDCGVQRIGYTFDNVDALAPLTMIDKRRLRRSQRASRLPATASMGVESTYLPEPAV